MEANELRIGNYIRSKNGILLRVDEIKYIDHQCYVAVMRSFPGDKINFEYTCTICDSNPIPLTEEILKRCGFKNLMGYHKIYNGVINKAFSVDKFPEITGTDHFYHFLPLFGLASEKIEYLHQLQNLYFALTGKEMEVTL